MVKQPVSGVDLPPTFFGYAEIDLPWKMHGHDLQPILSDAPTQIESPALLVHTARTYGSQTAEIPLLGDPELLHGPGIPWYVMLAEGKFKYVRTLIAGETEELYDLDEDPDELVNLAADLQFRSVLEAMRSATTEELRRTDAPFVAAMPKTALQ